MGLPAWASNQWLCFGLEALETEVRFKQRGLFLKNTSTNFGQKSTEKTSTLTILNGHNMKIYL
jgi:hypothetical protein